MTASDDDRIAYLEGDAVTSLSPAEQLALDALREELRSPFTWEEPDPELEDRVVRAIALEVGTAARGEAADEQTPPSEAATTSAGEAAAEQAPAPSEARRPQRRRLFSGRRWGWRPALAGSLVAAAVIVAIVVVTTVGGTAPAEQFAMAVVGTPLAPTAHGSATLTKMSSGWRIELTATGLPRRDGKEFYEAWLKNAAGVLVPVGTFNDARQVTLWSGVPVTKFRTLSVTQQVADGNPASSGRRVLLGTIR